MTKLLKDSQNIPLKMATYLTIFQTFQNFLIFQPKKNETVPHVGETFEDACVFFRIAISFPCVLKN